MKQSFQSRDKYAHFQLFRTLTNVWQRFPDNTLSSMDYSQTMRFDLTISISFFHVFNSTSIGLWLIMILNNNALFVINPLTFVQWLIMKAGYIFVLLIIVGWQKTESSIFSAEQKSWEKDIHSECLPFIQTNFVLLQSLLVWIFWSACILELHRLLLYAMLFSEGFSDGGEL